MEDEGERDEADADGYKVFVLAAGYLMLEAKVNVTQLVHAGFNVPHCRKDLYNQAKLFLDQKLLHAVSTYCQEASVVVVGEDM